MSGFNELKTERMRNGLAPPPSPNSNLLFKSGFIGGGGGRGIRMSDLTKIICARGNRFSSGDVFISELQDGQITVIYSMATRVQSLDR